MGEAPGETEEEQGVPFVGYSGQELTRLLDQAGINRDEVYLTNVFFTRPPNNRLEAFCVPKDDPRRLAGMPSLQKGEYVHNDLGRELTRLADELTTVKPNIIVAAGNTAVWALLKVAPAIGRMRGTLYQSPWGKVIPTYHPAALRDWSLRPVIINDLIKARAESAYPEIRRTSRRLLIDPTLQEVLHYIHDIADLAAVDIETRGGSITCLGIAKSPTDAICIPFFDARVIHPKPGGTLGSYWTVGDEIVVRKVLNQYLSGPLPKVTQNGLYDIQYLMAEGFNLCNFIEDTMIMHHSLYPELPKSLDFLGSIYANEMAWKMLRPRGEEKLKGED